MTNIFGVDIKSIIGQTFKGQLGTGTLVKVVNGARATGSLTAGPATTETSYSFDGLISDYTDAQMAGTLIQMGDRKITMIAASFDLSGTIVPMTSDKITIEGQTYRVVDVKRDPVGATYECQVRK